MWKDILYFEIQQGFKKVSVWVYFIIFFALAFLIANILGGAFTGASIVIGNQGTNVNSPLLIAELQTVFLYKRAPNYGEFSMKVMKPEF